MEWIQKSYQVILIPVLIFILSSCASSSFDESILEQNAADQDVLSDTFIVEEQKKMGELPPDKHLIAKRIKMQKEAAVSGKTREAGQKKRKDLLAKTPFIISADPKWAEQEVKSQEIWQKFSPAYLKEGERHILNVSFSKIHAATTILEIRPLQRYQSRDVFHFHARAKTADYYSWIYQLNDTIDTLVDKEFFVPWKYSLLQREKNKSIDDIQFYDRKSLMTYAFYKKVKNEKTEQDKRSEAIPFFGQDYYSSFYFIRGLPLNVGDHYLFPATTKANTWLMSVKVIGKEMVSIGLGKFSSIKVEIISKYSGDFAKKGSVFAWFSDDEHRALLSAKAEVKIGSIQAELAEYRVKDKLIFGKVEK